MIRYSLVNNNTPLCMNIDMQNTIRKYNIFFDVNFSLRLLIFDYFYLYSRNIMKSNLTFGEVQQHLKI